MKPKLFIDIETFSSVDLKNQGVYKYVNSFDFEILLIAYAIDQGKTRIIDLTNGDDTVRFVNAITSDKYELHAHNATFERIALNKWFNLNIHPDKWHCTMALSARSGLPLGLSEVGKALNIEKAKMKEGKDLIRYFCLPCKPTKTNKGRTRNLPEHAPEKWQMFKDYCMRDVEAEQEIHYTLHRNTPTAMEREVYVMDQLINDRGVMLDRQLAEQAVYVDGVGKDKLTAISREITGLQNPNSLAQLSKWLSYKLNTPITKLRKEDVHALLNSVDDEDVITVLNARQELGKTSVSKYSKMLEVIGDDDRARGLIQYYGANRTGRFAGRLIQVQNLPQPHMSNDDLTLAREVIKSGDHEYAELMYGNVPDTLSQLIRTAFVATQGKMFAVADYAQIEARVIAWLAGEQWRIDTFNRGDDIYIASASMMFNIPKDHISKGSEYRKKGKIAELACIAENELVLTDIGLIPIQEVTTDQKVWDGCNFVKHEGVIFKGNKKIINYDGLRATKDHLVWVEGQSGAIPFGDAAARGKHLVQTGDGGHAIRLGEDNISREKMVQELEKHSETVRVYDIVNAGSYNRYTVSGKLVHNCGFGGGTGAIKAFSKMKDFLTPEQMELDDAEDLYTAELQHIIDKWREASPSIKKLWYNFDNAFKQTLKSGRPTQVKINGNTKHIVFRYEQNAITVELPSGRKLYYHKPSLTTNRFGSESFQYWGMDQTTKQWVKIESYGGKLTENIVQAIARDLLCYVMLRVNKLYPIVMHVHDELIAEVDENTAEQDLLKIYDIMAEPITWANGLPTKGDGFITKFYKKD